MKIGFDRNTEEIQLFGKSLKIASLTVGDLFSLDTVNVKDVPQEHLNAAKMLLSIKYALEINYEIPKFTWKTNPFKYFVDCYHKAILKRLLSYQSLKDKLTLKNIVELTNIIERLNSLNGEIEKKKKE